MPPMFKSSRPARSVGATKNQFVYRKYNHAAKAQPPRQVSKQHQELVDVAIAANALCKRLKGN